MKRRPDCRQYSLLLPLAGGSATPVGRAWEAPLRGAIAVAVARHGKAMVAALAGSDQRSVENWLVGRNLPSLGAAILLAAALPDFAAALDAAIRSEAEREVA